VPPSKIGATESTVHTVTKDPRKKDTKLLAIYYADCGYSCHNWFCLIRGYYFLGRIICTF
jgi:hypothetical protein